MQQEEKDLKPKDITISNAEKERALFISKEFSELKQARDQGFRWFGMKDSETHEQQYLTLLEYVEESTKRLNGTMDKSELKDSWQANVFDPVTRDKFISIVARIAAQRMKAQFFNSDGVESEVARIVTNLYDVAGRGKLGQGKDEAHQFLSMWEAAEKGTVVREETYRLGRRKVKDNELFNKNGKIKYKTIYEWEDVWSEIIPLEEFYPGDISRLSIQEMGKCMRCTWLDYETFRQAYQDYDRAENVMPISDMSTEEKTLFSIETNKGAVRILKYYNRMTDSFDILANDVLLTKLGNPLPHPHKQLPFTVARFELLSTMFFYGMSLPMKLSAMQDINNTIWNLMLDQMFIALKTPIFNSSGAEIDTNWLYPSQVINLPRSADINKIREFQVTPRVDVATMALNIVKKRLDEHSATGSEQMGISGSGRERTAEEVATARESAMEIMGLFLRMMEWAEEDRAEQRVQNILYYYSKKLKSTGKYRTRIINNVRLIGRELGTMILNITEEPREKEELNEMNLQTEDMSQIVDIDPYLLRNFKAIVKIVPNSSIKETEYQKKVSELQWFNLTAQHPLVNQKENIRNLAEVFGKDTSKILNTETPENAMMNGLEQSGEPMNAQVPEVNMNPGGMQANYEQNV